MASIGRLVPRVVVESLPASFESLGPRTADGLQLEELQRFAPLSSLRTAAQYFCTCFWGAGALRIALPTKG